MTLRVLIFLAAFCAFPACAMPPFSYNSALRWADETVHSEIPKPARVYVLGPEKGPEIYGLNGLPALHEVEKRRAYAYVPGLTLGAVLAQVPTNAKKILTICVYRGSAEVSRDPEPIFTAQRGDHSIVHFALKPRDIVYLGFIDPNEPPRPNG